MKFREHSHEYLVTGDGDCGSPDPAIDLCRSTFSAGTHDIRRFLLRKTFNHPLQAETHISHQCSPRLLRGSDPAFGGWQIDRLRVRFILITTSVFICIDASLRSPGIHISPDVAYSHPMWVVTPEKCLSPIFPNYSGSVSSMGDKLRRRSPKSDVWTDNLHRLTRIAVPSSLCRS
jgi:hypothetical protein